MAKAPATGPASNECNDGKLQNRVKFLSCNALLPDSEALAEKATLDGDDG